MINVLWFVFYVCVFVSGFFVGRFFENNRFMNMIADEIENAMATQKEIDDLKHKLEKYSDKKE